MCSVTSHGALLRLEKQRRTEVMKKSSCKTGVLHHKWCLSERRLKFHQHVAAESGICWTGAFLCSELPLALMWSTNQLEQPLPFPSHLCLWGVFGVRAAVGSVCFAYCSNYSLLTLHCESGAHRTPMRTAVSADARTGTSIAGDHRSLARSGLVKQ